MQLELAPERLDQRRERALVASLGPLEIDGHRLNDTRPVGNGPAVRFASSRCLCRPYNRELEMSSCRSNVGAARSHVCSAFGVRAYRGPSSFFRAGGRSTTSAPD